MSPPNQQPPNQQGPPPPNQQPYTQPSDIALIETHLRPWSVNGAAAPFVHQADVYSTAPADLANSFPSLRSQDGSESWYFLTSLRPIPARGGHQRMARAVAGGTWRGEREKQILALDGTQIGRHLACSYLVNQIRTGWLMVQLRTPPEPGSRADSPENLRALCRLYKTPRNRNRVGSPSASTSSTTSTSSAPASTPASASALLPQASDGDNRQQGSAPASASSTFDGEDRDPGVQSAAPQAVLSALRPTSSPPAPSPGRKRVRDEGATSSAPTQVKNRCCPHCGGDLTSME